MRKVSSDASTGLNDAEVAERRAAGLSNITAGDTGRSLARIVSANVFTVFNGVVGGSFCLLLVLGAWQDALFGFFVIANTFIGVVQEFGAQRTLARLAVLNAPHAIVRRSGVDVPCAVTDVVLDDLLVLRPGGQLSADAVLVEGRDLELDESLLTGEVEPVTAGVGRELLSGSTVVAGAGIARVIGVGGDSYAARLTSEARQFSLVNSELRSELARVVRWLSIALLPIGALVVNGQMQAAGGWSAAISDGSWRQAGVASVASIIAMIPAGLVFMTSVALAVSAVRLARQQVLVRELAAVEGLARVDIICIDKTGTLTEGSMTLESMTAVSRPADGWRVALASLVADPAANATSRAIADGLGDAAAVTPDGAVAFASGHKWSAVHFGPGPTAGSWVLGGPDVVLSSSLASAGIARAAADGERTLVLAHTPQPLAAALDVHTPQLPIGLQPVALLVLRDRVRTTAAETVGYFVEQGVEVCVISGDDPRTVAAVAHKVGLSVDLPGVDARALPVEATELADAMRTNRIYGRVTPQQKRDMVLALRSLGHTVAMIGDGVNDTLALKRADLGIAMGSGSAAARAVAHVVLLDGDLSRLPGVLAEGRQVLANVERLAKLFLTKTVYAIALAVVFGASLWVFPFLPRQLSVVDGLTIGLPAMVLALLPNARIYRLGFLRRAARFCVPSGLVVAAAVLAVVACSTLVMKASPVQVQTTAVITLTLCGLGVLGILARPYTRGTALVVVGGYAGLIAVILVPVARDFLQLAVPSLELLILAIAVSAVALLVLELVARRMLRRR